MRSVASKDLNLGLELADRAHECRDHERKIHFAVWRLEAPKSDYQICGHLPAVTLGRKPRPVKLVHPRALLTAVLLVVTLVRGVRRWHRSTLTNPTIECSLVGDRIYWRSGRRIGAHKAHRTPGVLELRGGAA